MKAISVRRVIGLLLIIGIGVLAWALYRGALRVEDRWNPWAALNIDDSPNLFTSYKLAQLSRDPLLCQQVLAGARMHYTPLADRETGPGCGFSNAVRIRATSAATGAPFTLSCRGAVSLAMWEKHTLQVAAYARYAQRVDRIEHLGSYACRDVRGGGIGRRSRHATADAIDISGFVLADGHRIRVLSDWSGDDRDARFLRALHTGGCRYFDTALGPDYNAAHRDHLHLDRGSFGLCR